MVLGRICMERVVSSSYKLQADKDRKGDNRDLEDRTMVRREWCPGRYDGPTVWLVLFWCCD
jgi:hypothetical protein